MTLRSQPSEGCASASFATSAHQIIGNIAGTLSTRNGKPPGKFIRSNDLFLRARSVRRRGTLPKHLRGHLHAGYRYVVHLFLKLREQLKLRGS